MSPRPLLSFSLRGYLVAQVFGAAVVNTVVNGAAVWPLRHEPTLTLWGAPGLISDTLLTSLLLSSLTALLGTFFVELDVRFGRVAPWGGPPPWPWLNTLSRSLRTRTLALTAVGLLIGALTSGGLVALAVAELSFHDFAVFKVSFAVLLGTLMTPVNVACVLLAASGGPR